jgi:antitoxin (DNA-binding transcriptional repressor) of toxin-antitoxin stability system
MKIFVEPAEVAERLEELISLVHRNDEVIICREGVPIAVLTAMPKGFDRSSDKLAMTAERLPK